MTGPENAPAAMSIEELLDFREISERVSGFLYKRVKDHLATLSPLLTPGRVLGKHVGSRESAPRADEALAELSQKYEQARGGPFGLTADLAEEALSAIGSAIHVYPVEYSHEAQGAKSAKAITMSSPVRWVVTYGSEYSLSQMRNLVLAQGERRTPAVRQFVVNALAFQLVLSRNIPVTQLLGDLRYDISVAPLPGLEKLPLVHISVQVPSFRPSDELLLTAVRLSGVPSFIELIDTNALRNLEDPLRRQLEALTSSTA